MDKVTYFWCLIIVAMTFFFIGVYKNFAMKIGYILWVNNKNREGEEAPIRLENFERLLPSQKTIMDEAILQRRITQRSGFLWTRHSLIFFGFIFIFALDLFLTFAGHYAHHYFHYDYFLNGPGKGLLKIGMELSGAALFTGLTLGLVHRIIYAGTEKTYVDLNLLCLLWLVVTTGFATEAFRLAAEPNDALISFSFIGGPIGKRLIAIPWHWEILADWMWCVHATITAAFFAYIPFSKFVHILAAPLGRSITQNGDYGIQKRQKISEGLL
jgi:nitrate reductase gamma subunit